MRLGQPCFGVLVAGTAGLHTHEYGRDIMRPVACLEDTDHHVIVGRDMEPLVVLTHLLIDLTAYIYRRVRWHPSVLEAARIESIALPSAYHFAVRAVLQIAIDDVGVGGVEC